MTDMKGITALIADDDCGIREIERERLEGIGHSCVEVGDIESVYRELSKGGYSYILLDMKMPHRNGGVPREDAGETCLRHIRKDLGLSIPVIIVTGTVSDPAKTSLLMFIGADDLLVKPRFDGEHSLEAAVAKCLDLHARKADAGGAAANWLVGVREGRDMTWTTLKGNIQYRTIHLKLDCKLNRLLYCISQRYRKSPAISDTDIMRECQWTESEYFNDGSSARGAIKNHLSRLRDELGVRIESYDGGFRFFGP